MARPKKEKTRKLYNFRLDPELAKLFEKSRKRNKVGPTEMFELILKFYLSLDPFVWEMLADWAKKTGLPIAKIADSLILNELSREEAFQKVHGNPSPTFTLPFQPQHITLRGQEQAQALIQKWTEIFEVCDEALENTPQMPISEMKNSVMDAMIQ